MTYRIHITLENETLQPVTFEPADGETNVEDAAIAAAEWTAQTTDGLVRLVLDDSHGQVETVAEWLHGERHF